MIDGYVMSDETLRTHMHLMHTSSCACPTIPA